MERISKGDKQMEKMVDKVKKLNADPEIAKQIEIEDEEKIWENTFRSAGRAEGIAEGRVEGEAIGVSKRNLEIARNMLKDKMPIDTIIKYTGLTKKTIEELQ